MITIDKELKIVQALFPYGVNTEEIRPIYETILPAVKELIERAETLRRQTNERAKATEPVMPPRPQYDNDDISTPDETPHVVTCVPEGVLDDKAAPYFKETDKHTIDATWNESTYGDSTHLKNDGNVVIKGKYFRIDTTWDYLKQFYDELPDQVHVKTLAGINTKKATALLKFYEDHPNFSCHIEKVGGSNALIKDEVYVNNSTHVDSDAGSIEAVGFENSD